MTEKLEVMSSKNYLIGQSGAESQFEGIAYKSAAYFLTNALRNSSSFIVFLPMTLDFMTKCNVLAAKTCLSLVV